ncbi:MAG: glycosyltransferase family 2 protein [Blastochloris sp.]|nr:glycosyltransferase family 2 protein [Blastochloris sp.]
MKISACIITLNEESNLPRCLQSLRDLVDEVVIVDSGSTDRTPFIATEFDARFIRHDWEGYVAQKNFALSKASYNWVLSIDADEELSSELRHEIKKIHDGPEPSSTSPSGYEVSRVVFYEGHWIRFGDWYPDRLVRLFDKRKASFAGGQVHERLEIQGPIEPLAGELHHYTYKDLADQKARIEHYSTLWAQTAHQEGKRANFLSPYTHALWRLFRSLFLKGSIQGGSLGWQIARLNAYEVYLKYKKLAALK